LIGLFLVFVLTDIAAVNIFCLGVHICEHFLSEVRFLFVLQFWGLTQVLMQVESTLPLSCIPSFLESLLHSIKVYKCVSVQLFSIAESFSKAVCPIHIHITVTKRSTPSFKCLLQDFMLPVFLDRELYLY
jgi:hypothetical protein